MKNRVTKKRTLQKAGFVHVAGWVRADKAQSIVDQIKADAPLVDKAIQNDRS
jgi:hypothetical protein